MVPSHCVKPSKASATSGAKARLICVQSAVLLRCYGGVLCGVEDGRGASRKKTKQARKILGPRSWSLLPHQACNRQDDLLTVPKQAQLVTTLAPQPSCTNSATLFYVTFPSFKLQIQQDVYVTPTPHRACNRLTARSFRRSRQYVHRNHGANALDRLE